MSFSLKNYSELKKIADGGMSEMFRAVKLSTNREVVIKKMALDPTDRLFSLEQFQNEIRNASSLAHENIITIIEHGNENDNYHIAMEYIDGCDFNAVLSDSSFNPKIGLMIVLKALQALRFSHDYGMVHGNIKPSNLLITKSGRVVLSDFGVSQVKAHGLVSKNCRGDFNTPLFISPEQTNQVAEQAGLESDVWAETSSFIYNGVSIELPCALSEQGMQCDLWSVGVLLYRICSGYYPFYDNDLSNLLDSIKHSEPTKINELVTDLPHSITSVIDQCLQKEPDQRPTSINPIINALEQYFTSQCVSDIDGVIAAFILKKMSVHSIPKESEVVSENISSAEPIVSTPSESQWQYTEYKTIQFVPPQPPAVKQGTAVLSWASRFFNPRSQFARPMIVLMSLVLLAVLGALLFKNHSEKLHQLTITTSTNVESTSVFSVEPKVQEANPATVPIQDSTVTTRPAVAATLPGSRTRTNLMTSQVNPTKNLQTKKQVQSTTQAAAMISALMQKSEDLPGVLTVTVSPPEAQVFIDGSLMSENEMTNGLRMPQGSYQISAKAAGYLAYERPIVIESNKTLQLSLELKSNVKGNGQLHIYSYPWANLYIDDELIGTTPTPSPISLVEGNHRVVLMRDGYQPYDELVTIGTGGVTRLQVQLKKEDEK
jgi:serine/threonine protein kinase